MEHAQISIFDGHNDALLELLMPHDGASRSFFDENTGSHIDLPRLQRGGVVGGMFAMFVPPEGGRLKPDKDDVIPTADGYRVIPQETVPQPYAARVTDQMIELANQLCQDSQGRIAIARTSNSLSDLISRGMFAIVLHVEGAEAILPDLSNLTDYFDRGLRSIGPVWSRDNAFGFGVPFQYPSSPDTGPGLTGAGRELIKACNKMGLLVDLAHMNEKGFWEVAGITDKPLVVSHAAANAVTKTSRNLTDKQLDALADSNGLIGLTFSVSDLHPTGANDKSLPLARLVEHIVYIADRIGIEHVAFGSDYDGATVPDVIPDIASFPKIISALRQAGFDDRSLNLIARDNWLRVLGDTWL